MKNAFRKWLEKIWPDEPSYNRKIRASNYFWGFWEDHGTKVLIAIMIIMTMLFVAYGMYWNAIFLNAKSNEESEWISFVGSYWGGILGGIVSGILSIGGTWLVIRFTRRTDYHRQRIENLPLINMEIIRNTARVKFDFIDNPYDSNSTDFIHFCLENVGTGVAVNLRFSTGEDWNDTPITAMFEPQKEIKLKKEWEGDYIEYKKEISNEEMTIELLYEDIFGNEYRQVFHFYRFSERHHPYDSYVEASIPELKKATRRKQYVQ